MYPSCRRKYTDRHQQAYMSEPSCVALILSILPLSLISLSLFPLQPRSRNICEEMNHPGDHRTARSVQSERKRESSLIGGDGDTTDA